MASVYLYSLLSKLSLGAPSEEFLSQPVVASDHPFLRANLPAMNAYRSLEQGKQALDGLIDDYQAAELGEPNSCLHWFLFAFLDFLPDVK